MTNKHVYRKELESFYQGYEFRLVYCFDIIAELGIAV